MPIATVLRLLLAAGYDVEARRPCTEQAICWYGRGVGEGRAPNHNLSCQYRYIAHRSAKGKLICFH